MKRLLLPILLLLLLPTPLFAQLDFEETKALAEQGDVAAQKRLGDIYRDGKGVDQNHFEAFKWYRLSAQSGDSNAFLSLGFLYYIGAGVPQHYIRAYVLYSLSAAQGNIDASYTRDKIAEKLGPDQLAIAQDLSVKCFESGFKDCPF